ncbi:MAG: hypothetical protein AAF235_02870 [Planctomycetota bacterium]
MITRTDDPASIDMRRELGLRADVATVLSGHQPGVWHGGILAKRLLLDAVPRSLGAARGWIVVDQDTSENVSLGYHTRDGEGSPLDRHEVLLRPASRCPAGTPLGCTAPLKPSDPLSPAVPAWLRDVVARLEAATDRTAADQLASVNEAVLSDRLGIEPVPLLNASALARTSAFGAFVQAMADNPEACVGAYNDAARAIPDAGVRALIARPAAERYELPLWRIRPGEPRSPVFSTMLDDIDPAELAPRALTMTAVLRRHACDLFIHGIGGAAYDRVMERWIETWRGRAWADGLAPAVVATATLLPLLDVSPASDRDVADAVWRLHHARHDPALLGDADAAKKKQELLRYIHAAKASGHETAAHFRELHELLGAVRNAGAGVLEELAAEVRRARQSNADAAVASDRTFPWPMHSDRMLQRLRERLAGGFDQDDVTP